MGYLGREVDTLLEASSELDQLRETWLERNVAAEGEVTILRERVDIQDKMIKKMDKQLGVALKMITLLRTNLAGEFLFSCMTAGPGPDIYICNSSPTTERRSIQCRSIQRRSTRRHRCR